MRPFTTKEKERFDKVTKYFGMVVYNDDFSVERESIKFNFSSRLGERIHFTINTQDVDSFEQLGLRILNFGYGFDVNKHCRYLFQEQGVTDKEQASEIYDDVCETRQRIVLFGYLMRSSYNNIIGTSTVSSD